MVLVKCFNDAIIHIFCGDGSGAQKDSKHRIQNIVYQAKQVKEGSIGDISSGLSLFLHIIIIWEGEPQMGGRASH